MSSRRLDRMALSLVTEPGDPRLRDLLIAHEPAEIVQAVRGRPGSRVSVPAGWTERGRELGRLMDESRARAARAGLRWICPGDPQWPTTLSDLDHVEPLHGVTGAPAGLWVRGTGNLAQLCQSSVAVVGARDCTTYGAECASELAADCAAAGWTVVSGAAYGIDGCAHRGALMMASPTVAVLACGADVDYPTSHAALLGRVADGGVVVSEQAPGQRPMKMRFLSRNRLIAALSQGTVVIEAALRSGSLNTLNWADQLGRTTMGLPGAVTSKASTGVHAALRGGKAVLVTSGADVVGELKGLGAEAVVQEALPPTEFDLLPAAARQALDSLDWRTARTPGELAGATRMSSQDVTSSLELLRRSGHASRTAAGWILVRRADLG